VHFLAAANSAVVVNQS
jgi:hypothetical protein